MLTILFSAAAVAQELPTAELVVQGASAAKATQTTSSSTVIPVDERLPAAADTAFALGQAAGVNVRQLGAVGAWSTVSLRGSTSQQVQVYLDGIPLNPDGSTAVNLSELPLGLFERLVIYRGTAPARYQSGAIGGVIDLQTSTGYHRYGSAWASAGTLNTWRAGLVGMMAGHLGKVPTDGFLAVDGFSTSGDFRYFSDNGTRYNLVDDQRRTRENNHKHQLAVHGRWRLGNYRARVTLMDALTLRDEGIPGPGTSLATGTALGTLRTLAVVQAEGLLTATRLGGRIWHQYRSEAYDDREGSQGPGAVRSTYNTHNLGFSGFARGTVGAHLTLEGAASFRMDRLSEKNYLTGVNAAFAERLNGKGTLAADLRLARDNVLINAQVQAHALRDRPLSLPPDASESERAADHAFSLDPRAGIRVQVLPWLSIRSSGGSYLRPPNSIERYGNRGVVKGNPALKPERGWQVDLGVGMTLPLNDWVTGAFELTGYTSGRTDLIAYRQNAQQTLIPINIDNAHLTGLETALTLGVLGWLDSQTALTLTHAVNQSPKDEWSGNQLPWIPGVELNQNTSVHYKHLVRVGHIFSYTSGNYRDATNWFKAAPRPLHSLFVRVKPFAKGPELEGEVLNLTNTRVQVVDRNPLDPSDTGRVVEPITNFVGYPLPGRTVMVTLRWTGSNKESPVAKN